MPTEQRIEAAARHMLGLGNAHGGEAPPTRYVASPGRQASTRTDRRWATVNV